MLARFAPILALAWGVLGFARAGPPAPASPPAPVAAEFGQAPSSELLAVVVDERGGVTRARGHGCLRAPVSSLYAALVDPSVLADRREVARWTVQREGSGPSPFRVHYEVQALVPVTFDMRWEVTVAAGSPGAPTEVDAHGEKVAGTRYISLLEDSVVVRRLDARTSAVEIVCRRRTAGHDADAAIYVRDLFASLRARVHGRPLPKY